MLAEVSKSVMQLTQMSVGQLVGRVCFRFSASSETSRVVDQEGEALEKVKKEASGTTIILTRTFSSASSQPHI